MSEQAKQSEVRPLAVNAETAAKMFGVSYPTIRNWEKNGWITGNRIGKQRFYDFNKLEHLAKFGQPTERKAI